MESIEITLDPKLKAVLDELKLRFGYDPRAVIEGSMTYLVDLYVKYPGKAHFLLKSVMKGR